MRADLGLGDRDGHPDRTLCQRGQILLPLFVIAEPVDDEACIVQMPLPDRADTGIARGADKALDRSDLGRGIDGRATEFRRR